MTTSHVHLFQLNCLKCHLSLGESQKYPGMKCGANQICTLWISCEKDSLVIYFFHSVHWFINWVFLSGQYPKKPSGFFGLKLGSPNPGPVT
jgi:hypothetical protein